MKQGVFEIEFRIFLADGNTRWLLSKGLVKTNSSGIATQMCGLFMDITKQKLAELEF